MLFWRWKKKNVIIMIEYVVAAQRSDCTMCNNNTTSEPVRVFHMPVSMIHVDCEFGTHRKLHRISFTPDATRAAKARSFGLVECRMPMFIENAAFPFVFCSIVYTRDSDIKNTKHDSCAHHFNFAFICGGVLSLSVRSYLISVN